MDLPGEAPTRAGRNHVLLALVAFVGLALAAVPVSDTLEKAASSGLSGILAPVAIAVPVTAVLMFASQGSPGLRERFGTFERSSMPLPSPGSPRGSPPRSEWGGRRERLGDGPQGASYTRSP